MMVILKETKCNGNRNYVLWMIVISAVIFLSCSKSPIQDDRIQYDAYKLIRDWYTLDTQFVNRAILWKDDSIWRDEIKLALDTTADTWLNMCATERSAAHLEQWYYIKNGKKIHPSAYPKT